ncbi:hypothetical protein GCM10027190_34860 [Spirosoma areae]
MEGNNTKTQNAKTAKNICTTGSRLISIHYSDGTDDRIAVPILAIIQRF